MSAGEWILLIVLATGALLLVWWWRHRDDGGAGAFAPHAPALPDGAALPLGNAPTPQPQDQDTVATPQETQPEPGKDEPEAVASKQSAAPPMPDDLTVIEGIGPKISAVLSAAGITTYDELARQNVSDLAQIVAASGIHISTPTTWPEQATLAAAGRWQELQELRRTLKRRRKA